MIFHFITVVWGESFTDLFLKIVIPSQLSPHNLPAFSDQRAVYKIYTTSTDAEEIKQSQVFKKLSDLMSTEFVVIDNIVFENSYRRLSECHKLAIETAFNEKAALIVLSPDSIFSDGSFANILKIVKTGKRAVMVAGFRVVKESFVPILHKHFYSADDLEVSINSRELVKLALSHLHPVDKSLFWDSDKFSTWPYHLYFDVPKEGIIIRPFHIHPLMVNPLEKNFSLSSTIDCDFIPKTCPNYEEIHVVGDSDEIAVVEMSNLARFEEYKPNKSSELAVARWAISGADSYHRNFVKHKIRYHFGQNSHHWATVEQYSDKVVNNILFWLKFVEPIGFYSRKLYWAVRLNVVRVIKSILINLIGEPATKKVISLIKKNKYDICLSVPKTLPKTAVIGASGFLGNAFLSSYRFIHPDCVGSQRKPSDVNVFHLDLLNSNITQLRLRETDHKEALILAAIPKIDSCEKEKELTGKVNVEGTLELVRQLVGEGIKPIFFSSDYVFDGETGNYLDYAPTNPITEYGRQKAEIEAKIGGITNGNYLVVRLSKVFSLMHGSNSILHEMASTLASGCTIRAAFDQIFCPTLISDVIKAVAFLQTKGTTGIVNICSKEVWSRYELALAIARAMGVDESRVIRVSLDELGFGSKRPKNTSMIPERLTSETQITFTPMSKCIERVAKKRRY